MTSIAYDLLFIVCAFVVTFLIGLPFTMLIPTRFFRNRLLPAPLFGYGFIVFITTILYQFGFNHIQIHRSLSYLALLILLLLVWRLKSAAKPFPIGTIPIYVLIWLVATLVIILPYWTGGQQFSSYQGWIHDQLSYLGSAMTYSRETFADVKRSAGEFFVEKPVSVYGAIELFRRPGIMHLYGVLTSVCRSEQYRMGYLFLAFLGASGILGATFFISNVFNCSARRAILVAAALYLGFWGQSYIDFNAWAMAGCIPLMLVIATYTLVLASKLRTREPVKYFELVPLCLLYAFSIYIYPENTIFQLPALFAIVLLADYKNCWRLPSLKIFLTFLFGIALTAFYFQGTIGWFIWAANFTKDNAMTQAVYGDYLEPILGQAGWFRTLMLQAVQFSIDNVKSENQKYVLLYLIKQVFQEGRFELIYYALIDGFYGLYGMYFLTPFMSWPGWLQQIWRLFLAIGTFLLLRGNLRTVSTREHVVRLAYLYAGVLGSMLLVFLFATRIYGMARGLYFVAPYFFILLFTPLFTASTVSWKKFLPLILVLTSQFLFGAARVIFAATNQPHYPLPYRLASTHYFPDGKTNFDLNLGRFDPILDSCSRIYVDVPNGWQEYFVVFYLYSKEKDFVKKIPAKTSFWAVEIIGHQKTNGKEDCLFSVKKKALPNGTEYSELHLEKTTQKF
jgi:hypothetical protein